MDEDGTARPPAPLTCCSCSGLSSSQQSIIDDAIAQVLGPGATMDSLVQLTPSPRSEVDETPAPAAARRFLPLGMRSIDPQAAGLRALAEAGIQGGGLWAEGTAETEAVPCRPVVLVPSTGQRDGQHGGAVAGETARGPSARAEAIQSLTDSTPQPHDSTRPGRDDSHSGAHVSRAGAM